jgi:hypothetical protein
MRMIGLKLLISTVPFGNKYPQGFGTVYGWQPLFMGRYWSKEDAQDKKVLKTIQFRVFKAIHIKCFLNESVSIGNT